MADFSTDLFDEKMFFRLFGFFSSLQSQEPLSSGLLKVTCLSMFISS